LSTIHKRINSIWNKEELLDQWKESIIVAVHKRLIKLAVVMIVGYPSINLIQHFFVYPSLKVKSLLR
jgi:cytochrome b